MRFWDASAIVPLCVEEPHTDEAVSLYRGDPDLVVWWASPVECSSAFARLRRQGILDDEGESTALRALDAVAAAWYEVQPAEGLRRQARRLLRLHPLRAADSLQLAAALEWAGTPPEGELVAFDDRLRSAARREGFAVP